MKRFLYLIDGVEVSQKIFERRQIFGEYLDAKFEIIERNENARGASGRNHQG